MHPFWLTFENSELEGRFQYEQSEARLPTDKICTLSLLAYEIALQYRGAFWDGIWPYVFLLRLVAFIVPLSVFSWCHLTFNRKDLLALQPLLAMGVKVFYSPWVTFFLELTGFPRKAAMGYYEEYKSKPFLLAVGITLALGTTGSIIPLMFSTMGTRVSFKRQFYILLVGLPLRFRWTRRELGDLSSMHPAGVHYRNEFNAIIDAYADVVLHFSNSSTRHQGLSPHAIDQIIAFLNFFGVGIVCLTWLWWSELLDRQRFLERQISYQPRDNHVKAAVYKESRPLRVGLDLNGWMEHPCFLLTGFVCMSCVGAVAWKTISLSLEAFSS